MLLRAIDGHWSEADGRGGLGNLVDRIPAVRELAELPMIGNLVEPFLGTCAFPVRGHSVRQNARRQLEGSLAQDLTIAVQNRGELAGFSPWTIKDEIQHVQPPAEILESMLAVRIHLDECGVENGPVRVIPGSHSKGRLTAEQIRLIQESAPAVQCIVGEGGVLLMRPLLLHASSAAISAEHRRVIHLEFASSKLPGGLKWNIEHT